MRAERPLAATGEAPHIELFVRWCESQPWSESYICQHFVGVRSFYKSCVRDDVLLRNPAEFVDAPKVHEEGQKRTFLTPLESPPSSKRLAMQARPSTPQQR